MAMGSKRRVKVIKAMVAFVAILALILLSAFFSSRLIKISSGQKKAENIFRAKNLSKFFQILGYIYCRR